MNTSTYIHFAPTLEENASIKKSEKILTDFLDTEVYISEKNKKQIYQDILNGFWRKWRDDGTVYIEHLIGVHKIALAACQEVWIKFDETLALICLLHDNIEDTQETFETLYKKYGFYVAISVAMISKISLKDFYNAVKNNEIICSDTTLGNRITSKKWKDIEFENIWDTKIVKNLKKERNQYYHMKFRDESSFQKRYEKNKLLYTDVVNSEEEWFINIKEFYELISFIKVCDRKHNNLHPKPDTRANEIKDTETNTFIILLAKVSRRCHYVLHQYPSSI